MPISDCRSEVDACEEVGGLSVVSCCDTAPVLEAAECTLDDLAHFVGLWVEERRLAPVGLWRDHGVGGLCRQTRLSCHRFAANEVRLQLDALAYNLGNFLRTLALPDEVKQWSMTSLRDRLVKISAKFVRHGRSVIFQMAEVMVPRGLFSKILSSITALRTPPPFRC
jgi:hypothetical protein